jgi:predicted permease
MRGMGVSAVRARDYFVGDDGQVALALMGAVGFLLLIGCANVALLLTTRFAARRREVAVRAALGCGRGRQVRQFVTESLLLFLAGAVTGMFLAGWLAGSLTVFLPEAIASQVGLDGIRIDTLVILFAGVLSIASGLVFGFIAAIRSTGTDLNSVMKDAGRSASGGSGGTLRTLAGVEIALAVVLLTGAGMMTDTFQRLKGRDLGFEPEGVLTVQAGLEAQRYSTAPARLAFIESFLERVGQLPGVDRAGLTTVNPLCCGDWGARVTVEGHPFISQEQLPIVQHQLVTPGFFEAMRMRIVRGRGFTAEDREGREPAAIVDDRAARRFWPGEDPIGKRIKRGAPDSPNPWLTVVGVVGTIEDEGEYTEAWYLPYAQNAVGPSSNLLHFMIRAADPLSLASSIRSLGASLDPVLALHDITTMDGVHSERLQQNRIGAVVTAIFAAAGLLLAALGLYGVLAFALAADTREIGIRRALGAPASKIVRLVIERGARVVVAGTAIGVPIAVFAGVALERVLPDAQLRPSLVLVAVAALAAAAAAATLVPMVRALRLNPLTALRDE